MHRLLITGGAGTLGNALTAHVLRHELADQVCIYSRGELLQAEMAARFQHDSRLRFFIGDVRDRDRLSLALRGVDTVVHAAALKRIDALEYNPSEAVRTNVVGTMNLIDACLSTPSVARVMAISSDKSSSPLNIYGATKLVMEKLLVAANAFSGRDGPLFSCCRYGNVAGSRGSVIPLWRECLSASRPLPVTDPQMSRFWIRPSQAVVLVLESLERMHGAEVFVPKLPSFHVTALAEAMLDGSDAGTEIVGLRPGEKMAESLISASESVMAVDLGGAYALVHTVADEPGPRTTGAPYPTRSAYTSDTNSQWLTADDLRDELLVLEAE